MEKLEPRLARLLEENRARVGAGTAEAAEAAQAPIEVTIQHEERLRPESGAEDEPKRALDELGARVAASQEPILARLRDLNAPQDVHALANAVTTRLTPDELDAVSQLDEVKIIRHERLDDVALMNESARVIEAVEASDDLGYTGRGIRVAILDSGVDGTHPALLNKVRDEFDCTGEGLGAGDHGTHVAGTVASNDAVFRGVAWQADLVNVKVLTSGGSGQPAWVIQGLEQAVRLGAQVANLSLGWSEPYHGWVCDDGDCILCQAADNAVRLGMTVVVAAGNEGDATANPPYVGMSNIRHPGAARRVITVGALDKAKALASFSSIGPGSARLSPGSTIRLTKPDVSGPGVAITSSVPGGGFSAFSGTSMAAPHVAAVAAMVLQKNPAAKPMMVKKLLEGTAEPVPYRPDEAGYGLVNAYAALMTTLA